MAGLNPVDAETALWIRDLVARHAQIFDNRSWDAISTAYTDDAVMGADFDDQHPVAGLTASADEDRVYFPHHTTDTMLHRLDDDTVRAWSKYFVVRGDGTAGSGDYLDTIVHTESGWRIAERRVSRGARPGTDPDGSSARVFGFEEWLQGGDRG